MGAYTAVVTGATGYLAPYLIKDLMEKGYNVRGVTRSVTNPMVHVVQAAVKSLPGKLTFHEADIIVPGSLDKVIEGADYVFHLATTVSLPSGVESVDPVKEFVVPAVEGTRNVLTSVAKHKATVKRTVITSSILAIMDISPSDKPQLPKNGVAFTEHDWNETASLDKSGFSGPLAVSKVQAETLAFQMAKEHGIDVVTVLPGIIMGPVFFPQKPEGLIQHSKAIAEGNLDILLYSPAVSDVRDCSRAHIAAAENPAAKGRYILWAEQLITSMAASEILSKRFPNNYFDEGAPELLPTYQRCVVDLSKVKNELGMELRSIEETLVDTCVTAYQTGFATPRVK